MAIWTRLYDPDRTPAHWLEIVRRDQFAVFVYDAHSQAPRDADGLPFRAHPCVALCEDVAEARRFASGVVGRHPELCCEIYDSGGKARPPLETVYDPGVRDQYEGIAHARKLALGGGALASVGIALAAVDISRDLGWIWGYVIGLKCLLVGGGFMIRGFVEWREFRGSRNDDIVLADDGKGG